MSSGTVVVEAAPRSGSLITARLAAEAGREVMAVPGSPLDPRAQGCNQLIRDGATLIQNAADVIQAIRPFESRVRAAPEPFELPDEMNGDDALGLVEQLLGPSPVPVDEIIRLSGAPSGAVQMALLELDLAGRLDRHAEIGLAFARLDEPNLATPPLRVCVRGSFETGRRRIAG